MPTALPCQFSLSHMFLLEAAMCHKFVASLNHYCHDFLLTVFSDVVCPFQKLSYLPTSLLPFNITLSNQIHYQITCAVYRASLFSSSLTPDGYKKFKWLAAVHGRTNHPIDVF
jgi:hypothetical protein